MSPRTEITGALAGGWESLATLADSLDDRQWATQSLCPDWTAQAVFAHVLAIEEALAGWWPDGPEAPPPFAAMGPIFREVASAPPVMIAARMRDVAARRTDELSAMDDDSFATPCLTPVGRGTYGRFMAIRVFDGWVHERDVRVPLGISGDDAGRAAEIALDEVRGSLGYIVGKRIGVPDGAGIAFELTGPVPARMFVKVDGRAAVVDDLPDPDVTLTTDSLTFMLLACGRIDPDEPIADGRVTWTGDPDLGARAARNLAFTM